MKRNLLFLFLLVLAFSARAQQKVLVPDNVYVADMHLKLSKDAQEEIQKHVDFLLKYPSYFQQKVDRADTYFPIIERIFKEEGLPNDFKYLVLQESGLVSDAVSTSNAVGFWQFKKEAASDMGLAISSDVDERKHIVESSRGAARYLLKHNSYYDNWIVTLLSYNLGFTGVKSTPEAKHAGKKTMPIEKDTHIYIQKFLAHKIAFENFVCRNPNPSLKLEEYKVEGGGSLQDIARATKIDIVELEKYNKWLGATSIPNNKAYTVLLPLKQGESTSMLASSEVSPATSTPVVVNPGFKANAFTSLNGLKAIVANSGDTKDKLAMQAKISTRKLLRYNDMNSFDAFVEGQAYYVQNKRTSADVEYYVAQPGETLQQIAQKFGVREKSIRTKNRMTKTEVLVAGRKLWMKKTRPRYTPAEYERLSDNKEEMPERIKAKVNFATLYHQETTSAPTTSKPEVLISKGNEFVETTREEEENQTTVPVKPVNNEIETVSPVAASPATTPNQENALASAEETTPVNEETPDAELPLFMQEDSTGGEEESTQVNTDEGTAIEVAAIPEPVKKVPVYEEKKPVAPEKPALVPVKAEAKPVKAPVAKTPSPAKTNEHVVQKGETFYSISKQYGLSTAEIMEANNMKSSALSIGQKLKIPAEAGKAAIAENKVTTEQKPAAPKPAPAAAKPAPATGKTHTVVQGESMYQIARKNNMTVIDLLELNNRTDTNLKPGEVLTISK